MSRRLALLATLVLARAAYAPVASLLGAERAYSGSSVAGDGKRVAMGLEDYASFAGAVALYDCSASPCTTLSVLQASTGAAGEGTGRTTAVSGGLVVSGAWGYNGTIGRAYVWDCSTLPCVEGAPLTPDPALRTETFGASVGASGRLVVVGATAFAALNVSSNVSAAGAAYVFDCAAGAACTRGSVLTAGADAFLNDHFGWSVSTSGPLVAVGAWGVGGDDSGAAYAFACPTPASCALAARLTDPAGPSPASYFGASVAVGAAGSLVAVGAWGADARAGKVVVFTCVAAAAGGCTPAAVLRAPAPAADDWLGFAVAANGPTVVVLAGSQPHPGRAGIYVWDCAAPAAGCTLLTSLLGPGAGGPGLGGVFGPSVAATGALLLAGAAPDGAAVLDCGAGTWGPACAACTAACSGVGGTCRTGRGGDGSCACKAGYVGASCAVPVVPVAGGVGGAVAALAVAALAVVVVRRRRSGGAAAEGAPLLH